MFANEVLHQGSTMHRMLGYSVLVEVLMLTLPALFALVMGQICMVGEVPLLNSLETLAVWCSGVTRE